MNAGPEVGKWLTDNNVLWLDGDELLFRVPREGIDETLLEEMILHRAEMADPLRRYQRERPTAPSISAEHLFRQPLHRSFELYAQMNPGAVAVKFDHTELTYGGAAPRRSASPWSVKCVAGGAGGRGTGGQVVRHNRQFV